MMRGLVAFLTCFALTLAALGGPGNALQFDGVNGYVMVTNNTSLNAFPLTVSGWFRTANPTYSIQAIATKYPDSSGNGWFLMVQNGRLRGYFSTPSGTVDMTSAAVVADGFWHHAALTVDSLGGHLYLDGVQVGAVAWGGTGAAPSNTDPLYIGRYSNTTNRFQGTLDEVAIWNRSLGAPEVNYLKHRALNGNEDGLLALYHFDEGTGTNAFDATTNNRTGVLVNNPAWVASSAPLVFNSLAGKALKLGGAGDYVAVPHDSLLDTLPITLMTWVRTSRSNATGDGIISKYSDGSFNGYAMFLLNGHVRAWYFKDGSHYVWDGSEGLDGGLISDGQWHHLALVVDTNAGRLYVDGAQTAALNWTGLAGPTTATNQLQFGRYYNYANTLLGLQDEVSVWNVALTPAQVAAYKSTPLTGSESGLLGLWRFNEGSGTNAMDLSPYNRTAAIFGNPTWTGSTAFLGDGTSAIHTTLGAVQWAHKFAVQTMPADVAFTATAPFWVRRLDDFNGPGGTTNVGVNLQYALQSTLQAGPVALINNASNFSANLGAYNAAAPQASAGGVIQSPVLNIQPGVQLASVSDTFALGVDELYDVNGGAFINQETNSLPPTTLLHFDGNLYFGTNLTIFSGIANFPAAGGPDSGGLDTQLVVTSGYLASKPAQIFSSSTLSVIIKDSGDCFAGPTASVNLVGPVNDCVQNICFYRTNTHLSTSGGLTAGILLQLPPGFSMSTSPTNRLTSSQLWYSFGGTALDGNLDPIGPLTFTFSPAQWAVEETKPFWMKAPSLNWDVTGGQLSFAPAAIQFVRQWEDDVLLANQGTLVNPNTAIRVSNDGYYRNAGVGVSGQAVVTADSRGVAQLTTTLALNPPELRPHFPYATNTPGSQISTAASGQLFISNSLIDTANSMLPISGPVPVNYATDCTDTNCSGAPSAPIALAFTPNGPSQLNFTVDGGLLSYGSVPTTSLIWGYNGTGHYAQTAGTVQSGVYEMAGTFLLTNQTAITGATMASVLLLSGFGDGADSTYLERLGQTNYPVGFGNYSGINFRTPLTGESFLAGADTGPYPLAPNCKYYVRAGGVSGIHQAQSFTGSPLSLYGYPFTFTSYALSFLDSENYESRTDGELVLPVPAGFTQNFTRMKFLCSGGLDSAQMPSSAVSQHLVYWDVNITPQSIQFAPQTNVSCVTAARFLVMGVETKLPFIPQAFHATLGFKPNGNLVTAADSVMGVDSRFPVPGKLNLQGSGTSFYPLAAASDGYFNNWENPNRPAAGFFTFAGKLRTPFFGEIKVQLHVTPSQSGGSPSVAIMGGWPSPDGGGQDMGWSINGSNYFNNAKFDLAQYGYPLAVGSVDAYRSPAGDQYRPRAQRNWIDVAQFDYPLEWDPVLSQFQGFAVSQVKLPIIDVGSRLKQLTPGNVNFDFSQDLTVQLPALKVLNFANDALNEINGPLSSVSNALRQAFGNTLDTTGLSSGFQSLQNIVREDTANFFRPILQPALQVVVGNIYSNLNSQAASYGTNTQAFLTALPAIISQVNGQLQGAISKVNGSVADANSVIGKLNNTLSDIDKTLGLFITMLNKDASGNRHVVAIIIQNVVKDQAPILKFVANVSDSLINGVLQDVDPTIAEIQQDLTDLKSQFDQLEADITSGTGTLSSSLGAITNQTGAIQTFVNQASMDLSNTLAEVITPAGDFFSANPAAAQQMISDSLITTFLSSTLPGSYQTTFRSFFSDKNFLLDQLMDVLFDQINRAIREDLDDQISGSQDSAFSALKGAAQLSQSLFSAKIRGSPTFVGDSLQKIHLDAAIKMMLPDEMDFNAYMEIKQLNSQSVPVGCIPAGGASAEVTLGATKVPLQWGGVPSSDGSQLTLDADARWTLQNGSVLGIGGTVDIHGGAQFQGCGLNDLGCSFAVGEIDAYLAARGDASVEVIPLVPVHFKAGFFAGHACSIDPLVYVDPDVTNALPNVSSFSGVYIQYGGDLSLSKILFGESDCLLDVGANISTQEYFYGGPRSTTIGFRQAEGLDVSLLCCLSGSAEFTIGASGSITPQGPELDLSGAAKFCGSLGPCPLCVSGCKTLTIAGKLTTKGVNYSLSY